MTTRQYATDLAIVTEIPSDAEVRVDRLDTGLRLWNRALAPLGAVSLPLPAYGIATDHGVLTAAWMGAGIVAVIATVAANAAITAASARAGTAPRRIRVIQAAKPAADYTFTPGDTTAGTVA